MSRSSPFLLPRRRWLVLRLPIAASMLVISALAPPLGAQSTDTLQSVEALREQFRLPVPRAVEPWGAAYTLAPAISANSPTAFGAEYGDLFFSADFQERARNVSAPDGDLMVGFGLGNAEKLVGLEVAVNLFSTVRTGLGHSYGIDFMVHRALPWDVGIAVGVESAIRRHADHAPSHFVVASKYFQFGHSESAPFSALTVSIGAGDGRFRSENDEIDDVKTVNAFGSAALRVLEPASLIADWTGQDLALGVSIVPFRKLPVDIMPGLVDVTGHAGDGARFVIAAGIDLGFTSLPH
jgi:hypothetical protein